MTRSSRNPQAHQMADESMVRNLKAQAEAIWPQEQPLFARHPLPEGARVLDLGCGTGEIAARLAALFRGAAIVGVDLLADHLRLAREHHPELGDRLPLVRGDAFELPFADGVFDLSVCRHLLQAVPDADRVLAEMMRVTRPGGRLHVLAEDYGMIYLHPTRLPAAEFWHEGPPAFASATGTDLHVGRKIYPLLRQVGAREIQVDYLHVDTLRVPRETFAAIWEAWRDGYTDVIAQSTNLTRGEVLDVWEDMLGCIRDPDGYALWMIPVATAVVP